MSLGSLREEDVDDKDAANRERDIAHAQYDEEVRLNSNGRVERDGMVVESDRAVEARDRAVEGICRIGTVNDEYEKIVAENQVFATKCAVTITKVGTLSTRLADFCTEEDDLKEVVGYVLNSGNELAD